MDLIEACASGDHRLALVALRDSLAQAMLEADANVKPQVAARLQAVLSELAGLADPEKGSAVDELFARREKRGAEPVERPRRRSRSKPG
jgi:hypothetical protein